MGDPGSIQAAALWLATTSEDTSPAVPKLKARFGLSPKDACEAIRQASALRTVSSSPHHSENNTRTRTSEEDA